jgi:hypothetical protein
MADEHLRSLMRDNPGTKPVSLFNNYSMKINWILRDLYTNPFLPQIVRDGIKRETESDVFAVPAIQEKISLLNPDQREAVEEMIEIILKGETITVELK